MSRSIHFITCLVAMLLIVSTAPQSHSEEIPATGIVYNTKETSSLTYACQPAANNQVECEFLQSSVRKKAKKEDLRKALKDAQIGFKDEIKGKHLDEVCQANKLLLDVLEGRTKAPKQEAVVAMSDMEKKSLIKLPKAMGTFCANKTEENYINVIKVGHEKDMRTCVVSTYNYKTTFKKVSASDGKATWVASGTPHGPCGVIDVSRFEQDNIRDGKIILWKYFSKKVVSNPNATGLLNVPCTEMFDQREYLYDWRSKQHAIGCDFVEFSTL